MRRLFIYFMFGRMGGVEVTNPQSSEDVFQSWYRGVAERYGLSPDPDDPLHFYDWRGAHRAGAGAEVSTADGEPHWPSQFKLLGHPNLVVSEGGRLLDSRTMQPATTDLIRANDDAHKATRALADRNRLLRELGIRPEEMR